jgi:ring-1,2-phenylacetyl-CoA epoxidase subunit PaaD
MVEAQRDGGAEERGGGADDAMGVLRTVMDPEVPVLSIVDLGIVRGTEVSGDTVRVDITPTYSGCPAMQVITEEVVAALKQHGYREVTVRTVYQPAWTTDWISEEGRTRLREYGIAPPGPVTATTGPLVQLGGPVQRIVCPFCGSRDTELRSEFGSTACKSLHVCQACRQPFEHFKAL